MTDFSTTPIFTPGVHRGFTCACGQFVADGTTHICPRQMTHSGAELPLITIVGGPPINLPPVSFPVNIEHRLSEVERKVAALESLLPPPARAPSASEGELLPCPFCGSKTAPRIFESRVHIYEGEDPLTYWALCGREEGGCDVTGPTCGTSDEATRQWNRRRPTPLLQSGELPELLKRLYSYVSLAAQAVSKNDAVDSSTLSALIVGARGLWTYGELHSDLEQLWASRPATPIANIINSLHTKTGAQQAGVSKGADIAKVLEIARVLRGGLEFSGFTDDAAVLRASVDWMCRQPISGGAIRQEAPEDLRRTITGRDLLALCDAIEHGPCGYCSQAESAVERAEAERDSARASEAAARAEHQSNIDHAMAQAQEQYRRLFDEHTRVCAERNALAAAGREPISATVVDLSQISPPYRMPVNSPFGPDDNVHPGDCQCERCRKYTALPGGTEGGERG